MKKTNIKKLLSLFVCVVFVAAIALTVGGCKGNKTAGDTSSAVTAIQQKNEFNFTVTHKDGTEKSFKISTDKATVGEALQAEGIIEGEEGAFGIYVKTVDGETLDYSVNKMYWAFYVDGKVSMAGADQTPIEQGVTYSFKAEKA